MTRITRGTSNVFADLGYADAAERQTKTRLALAVNELLKARKLKQREIAIVLGQPHRQPFRDAVPRPVRAGRAEKP